MEKLFIMWNSIAWYTFNILYLIIWSALLIHCLFRRELCPIFGRLWVTKILWLLTFPFLNPLLTFLYLAFGVLLRYSETEEQRKSISFGSMIAIACIIVVLVLFEQPFTGYKAETIVITSKSGDKESERRNRLFHVLDAHIGTIEANNSVIGSISVPDGTRVSPRNILIVCQNPHRLIDRMLREFQQSLVQLPYVDNVTYSPFGTQPEPDEFLPDILITIEIPKVAEKTFLCGRRLETAIKWKVSSPIISEQSHAADPSKPAKVKFNIEGGLNHYSETLAIESARAKYKLEASNIAKAMIKLFSKEFEDLLDKHERLPKLAETLHVTHPEPLELMAKEYYSINIGKTKQ